MPDLRTLMSGLGVGESPRWHDGRLWFANWGAQEIVAVDPAGNGEVGARGDLGRVAAAVQGPRVPIWVVGAWPRPKSMGRVLRCDGLLPAVVEQTGPRATTPGDVRAMVAWLRERGGAGPGFDVVAEGETPPGDRAAAAAVVAPWADAGCTWWLETRWEMPHDAAERMRQVRERLAAGPPRPA